MFNSSPAPATEAAAAAPTTGDGAGRPRHVAVIMDGNGRWAKTRGLPRLAGHRRGAEVVRQIVEAAPNEGVSYLTLYAFSTENWKRSSEEVQGLMELFSIYIRREGKELKRRGARVRFIGDRTRLNRDLAEQMRRLEASTLDNDRLNLTIAINYGGRDEILDAVRRVAVEIAAGRMAPEALDAAAFSAALDTRELPDPDLVIRTSGEMRTSNFLPWQSAYAEYAFVPETWPDFSPEIFARTCAAYGARNRRFGAAD